MSWSAIKPVSQSVSESGSQPALSLSQWGSVNVSACEYALTTWAEKWGPTTSRLASGRGRTKLLGSQAVAMGDSIAGSFPLAI